MTTDELISLLQDLEVPADESASLVSLVSEQGWTADVKQRVLATIDEYAALKQEETDVLEKTRDILDTRDEEVAAIDADAASTINAVADEADAAIKAVEDGLGAIEQELAAPTAAPQSPVTATVAPPPDPTQPAAPTSPTV